MNLGEQLWPAVLTVWGLTGFILVGKKFWWAWLINLSCQVLWIMYALYSEQYAFILAAVAYIVVFSRNHFKWATEHFTRKREIIRDEYLTQGIEYDLDRTQLRKALRTRNQPRHRKE